MHLPEFIQNTSRIGPAAFGNPSIKQLHISFICIAIVGNRNV